MMSMYDLMPTMKPWEVRLFSYVLIDDGCWAWLGHHHRKDGYAQFSLNAHENNGRKDEIRVHRYLYELLNGPIQEGLEPDHLCRNRGCINPGHLEPVSHLENMHRRSAYGICKAGHDLSKTRRVWACGRSCCGLCYDINLKVKRDARTARGFRKRGRTPKSSAHIRPDES